MVGSTTKAVTAKITKIIKSNPSTKLIQKDNTDRWQIHHLVIPRLTPKQPAKHTSFTLVLDYPIRDLDATMRYISERGQIQFHFETETTPEGKNHLHGYLLTTDLSTLADYLYLLTGTRIHTRPVYDLDNWLSYINKQKPTC